MVLDGLLGPTVAAQARAAALCMDAAGELRPAGIGRRGAFAPSIRGDRMAWIDELLAPDALVPILALMYATREALNQLVYLGADEIECQVAIYDAGAGYERHRDAVRGRSGRRMTAVYHLGDWRPGDGGELELSDGDGVRLVEPVADRLVLFRSDVTEHAVRTVLRGPRLAVSAFFGRRSAL